MLYSLNSVTPMSTFPKKYDHSFEQEMYDFWLEQGCFNPETVKKLRTNNKNETFSIAMPPPNVTGVLHL
ncbi:MAG: class I tRNA ligase family protein [Candidatus Peribacteria bacterium]|nr:MAG: class I tRNA ligase family protein [Candidatus Peribacteria bacterium]